MTISFPLADFLTSVSFAAEGYNFYLQRRQELSRSAFGQTFVKDLGDPLWTMKATTIPLSIDDALDFESLIDSLGNGLQSFRAFDLRRRLPRAHADGAFSDTSSIVDLDGDSAALQGLPAGFVLSRGDYLSFPVAGQMMLHQCAETVVSGSDGKTPAFSISPALWPGSTDGAAVTLKEPYTLMSLTPGSVTKTQSGSLRTSIQFQAYQSL